MHVWAAWVNRHSFKEIAWLMLSLWWHACFPSLSRKVQSFIDSDSAAGLRSVGKKQHQTEIYGACEQLVGLGSAMRGCNSRKACCWGEERPMLWSCLAAAEQSWHGAAAGRPRHYIVLYLSLSVLGVYPSTHTAQCIHLVCLLSFITLHEADVSLV